MKDCRAVLTFCWPVMLSNGRTSQWHIRVRIRVNTSKQDHPVSLNMFGIRGDVCVCLCAWVWLSTSVNYRIRLLFNRSAEEVVPQSMSQPSCIIAPVCHRQRLGKATSDCLSPCTPYSPSPSLSFPLSPPVLTLIRLINLSIRDR